MIRVLRVSKSLKPVFQSTAILQPGEHCDLAVILSSDYLPWMDAAAHVINPVVVDSAEDAVTFLRGMRAVAQDGNWPKELDNDSIGIKGSTQA